MKTTRLLPAFLFCCLTAHPLLSEPVVTHEPNLTRLVNNTSPHAQPQFDQGRVPDSLPQQHILMLLRRSATRQRALDAFTARQYNPHSHDFHRWLTPHEFGARFGPPIHNIKTTTNWLTEHGFKVNRVPAGGLFIDFSGTAGEVERAFHTEIHRYRVNGVDHIANSRDPYIPTALAPMVAGFRALNDFHPQPHARHLGTAHLDRTSGKWARTPGAHLTSAADALYIVGPQDFATIYGINQVWQEGGATPLVGTGQTIAVVGETNIESADIQTFRDQFGITALGPNGSVIDENPPSSTCDAPNPTDNVAESYLDAEWSGATAPDATIDFVACAGGVTSGADLAAAYVISDPAHVQSIGVLSTSYGDCEALPYSAPNQFYVSLWQQAAAEGITVVVASGDTGGDGCQYVNTYTTDGLSVVNAASTPYNIAVGGTDFSDTFSGATATYWSATNGANFLSAQSYIPETPWNETCASPLVLARFGAAFTSSIGSNGFCAYAAQQPAEASSDYYSPYFFAFASSGGLSTVSPRPSWQTGVPGLPTQPGRAVPDISMFASGGYTWGQSLILCDSAFEGLPPGTACDFTNSTDVTANYGGGTSFDAPAFAGIMALINQKNGGRQGQANNILYPLAAEQYVTYGGATQPNLANCAAYLGPQALSTCYFHDVSATPNTVPTPAFVSGNTQVPCTGTATSAGTFTDTSTDPASNSENCDSYQITVTGTPGSLTTTPDYYGGLATAPGTPAFTATPGYDLATGLGSPNVYSLVNAPQWAGGGLQTTVQLSVDNANITAAQSLNLLATVTDQNGAPVLGGTVTFYSGTTVLGTATQTCSATFSVAVPGTAFGPTGFYRNVFAAYTGGAQQCEQKSFNYYGAQASSIFVAVDNEWLGANPTHLPASVPRPPQPAN